MGPSVPLPGVVSSALWQTPDKTSASSGFDQDGEYCWLYCTSQLFVWPVGSTAEPLEFRSPLPITGSASGVIVKLQDRLIVALVSEQGNICTWPIDEAGKKEEVILDRVAGKVVAVTSAANGGSTFLLIATDDSAVHCLAVSQDATFTTLRKLGDTQGDTRQAGFLGRLMGSLTPMVRGGGASGAVALHAAESPGDPAWLDLLVLSRDDLTCWQVNGEAERVVWRLEASQLTGAEKAGLHLIALAVPPTLDDVPRSCLAVVLAAAPGKSEGVACSVTAVHSRKAEATAQVKLKGVEVKPDTRLCCNGTADAFLVWERHGIALAWSKGAVRQLMAGGCLGAGVSGDGAAWQLMDLASGTVTFPVRPPRSGTRQRVGPASSPVVRHRLAKGSVAKESLPAFSPVPQKSAPPPRRVAPAVQNLPPFSPVPQKQAGSGRLDLDGLLDAAATSGEFPADFATKLQEAGGFEGLEEEGKGNPIVVYSTTLVDALPKHWGGGKSIPEQLRDKQTRHNLLLQLLEKMGVLARLQPATLSALFGNGDKVAALGGIYEREEGLLAAQDQEEEVVPLQVSVRQAGQAIRAHGNLGYEGREDRELFYSTPALSITAWFAAIQSISSDGAEYPALRSLSFAFLAALSGWQQQQAWHSQHFAAFVEQSRRAGCQEWTSDAALRTALKSLCQAYLPILPELQSRAPQQLKEATWLLQLLTDPLLNAFAAAEARSGTDTDLTTEYHEARSQLLGTLLDQAIRLSEEGDEFGEQLMQSVESTAAAHRGYEQLFDIAAFHRDSDHLYSKMSTLLGTDSRRGEGGMAEYVFDRLVQEGRTSELQQLPEKFNAALEAWLESQGTHPHVLQIRWMHHLRMQKLREAAHLLRGVRQEAPGALTVEALKRTAMMSKLATLAAQTPGSLSLPEEDQVALRGDNAVLALARVQSGLEVDGSLIQPPQALLEAAAEQQNAQAVFITLAAGGSDFRTKNRHVWEEAVRSCITQFDWDDVRQRAASLSQADTLDLLRGTPVALMAGTCYAGNGEAACISDTSVDEELPQEAAQEILAAAVASTHPTCQQIVATSFELGKGGSIGILAG